MKTICLVILVGIAAGGVWAQSDYVCLLGWTTWSGWTQEQKEIFVGAILLGCVSTALTVENVYGVEVTDWFPEGVSEKFIVKVIDYVYRVPEMRDWTIIEFFIRWREMSARLTSLGVTLPMTMALEGVEW